MIKELEFNKVMVIVEYVDLNSGTYLNKIVIANYDKTSKVVSIDGIVKDYEVPEHYSAILDIHTRVSQPLTVLVRSTESATVSLTGEKDEDSD